MNQEDETKWLLIRDRCPWQLGKYTDSTTCIATGWTSGMLMKCSAETCAPYFFATILREQE